MGVLDPGAWSLPALWVAFAIPVVVLTLAGIRIVGYGAALSRRTGLGQAIFGAAFIGAATSLSGIVVSVHAAATGHPGMAIGNALGGIAAQTVFLTIADITFRPANIEHAAASTPNMLQAALLTTLLALPLMASASPDFALLGVSPYSLLLFAGYGLGLWLSSGIRRQEPWAPRQTRHTVLEDDESMPEKLQSASMARLWGVFAVLALVLGTCGYMVSRTGIALAERYQISETVVGTYLTAVSTSLPELVTALAAVHRGALALAVGDILGGNAFDTLLVALSDVAYRDGSIYAHFESPHVLTTGMAQVLTGLILMGLIRREQHGVANIGFESMLSLLFYLAGAAILFGN
jgi:cation:H+ antiporter